MKHNKHWTVIHEMPFTITQSLASCSYCPSLLSRSNILISEKSGRETNSGKLTLPDFSHHSTQQESFWIAVIARPIITSNTLEPSSEGEIMKIFGRLVRRFVNAQTHVDNRKRGWEKRQDEESVNGSRQLRNQRDTTAGNVFRRGDQIPEGPRALELCMYECEKSCRSLFSGALT